MAIEVVDRDDTLRRDWDKVISPAHIVAGREGEKGFKFEEAKNLL